MKLSYYPGCSLTGTAREYDQSVREVSRLLGIELVELQDWNCCGASSAHMTDHKLTVELSARNLQLAGEQGLDVLVPCSACFQRLRYADVALREHPEQGGMTEWAPDFKVVHLTALFSQTPYLEKIRQSVTHPLKGLKAACYYGCLSMRPPSITGAADYEHPRGLDLLLEAVGGEPVRWSHKTECCSGSLSVARPDITSALVADILTAAHNAGATAVVTDCPMCQGNLETRQLFPSERNKPATMPVFFPTELIVLALTGPKKRKYWKKHLVDPGRVLAPLGL